MKLYCKKCRKIQTVEIEQDATTVACPDCSAMLEVPESPTSPGVVLGDFLIEKPIGKGGMGEVYRARQISLDRPVALKVLFSHADPDQIQSLIHEARAAGRLSHPNIVQAYAVGEEDGIVYFAMEYIKGKTTKELLKTEKTFDFDRAAKIVCEIASALACAWRDEKLVHQDIKPDNIMIDSHGFAKLADLGIARRAGINDAEAAAGDEVLGTPQYISPEQLTGVPTDVRSDIYSLGATFYQFVTGRFPYVADTSEEIARMHVAGKLRPPKEVNRDLPDVLNHIIVKMMARDINARYQSPEELVSELEAYLTDSMAVKRLGKKSVSTHSVKIALKPFAVKPLAPAAAVAPDAPAKSGDAIGEVPPLKPAAVPVAAPKPVALSGAVPLKPAAIPAAVPVASPPPAGDSEHAAAPVETAEDRESGDKKDSSGFPINIGMVVIVVLVLGAVSWGSLKIFGKKVPAKEPETAVENVQSPAPSPQNIAEPEPALPEPPAPPVVVEKSDRAEYLAAAAAALQAMESAGDDPDKILSALDQFYRQYAEAETVGEQNALAQLRRTAAAADENLRAVPFRAEAEPRFETLLSVRREAAAAAALVEKERAAAERRRQAAIRAEERRLRAERRQREERIQAEVQAALAAAGAQLEPLFRDVSVAFLNGDSGKFSDAAAQLKSFEFPEVADPAALAGLRGRTEFFSGQLADEYANYKNFIDVISRIDGASAGSFTLELPGKKLVKVCRVSRDGVTVRDGKGQLLPLELTPHARITERFYERLQQRNKLQNAEFYYSLYRGDYAAAAGAPRPDGFWSRNFDDFFRVYFGALLSSSSDAERDALVKRYGDMEAFKQALEEQEK